jgi:predicted kinase
VDVRLAAAAVREALDAGPSLIVLIGAAGSGKSTLAADVTKPSQVLSLDALRAAVSDDECDQDATPDAVAVMHLLLDARLCRRRSTLIDATNAEAPARGLLVAIAHRHRVPALAVAVATPLETCLARNAIRPGPLPGIQWGRRVPDPVVRTQHARCRDSLASLRTEGFSRLIVCEPDGAAQ